MHCQFPGGSFIPVMGFLLKTGQVRPKIPLTGRSRGGNILRRMKRRLNEAQPTQSGKEPPFALLLHTGTSQSLTAPVSAGETAGRSAAKARFAKTAFTTLEASLAAVSSETAFAAFETSFTAVTPKTSFTALEASFAAVSAKSSLSTLKTSLAAVSTKSAITALETSYTTNNPNYSITAKE
ncbi:hypothetical protein, partial [Akkermansia sp.]|uniref:hypothetical protein n=1 Tax=Akkermansia sp. TaxID=1872421 RepID=UPI0025B8DE9E